MAGGWDVGLGLQTGYNPGVVYATAPSSGAYSGWTQICASTPFDISWVTLVAEVAYPYNSSLFDIAVGAAGSEITVIASLVGSGDGSAGYAASVMLPLSIPAGSRVSMRSGSAANGRGLVLGFIGFADTFGSAPVCGSRYDTYGTNAALWAGTAIDPGGTAATKGAFVQLTASCANDYNGFFVCLDHQGRYQGTTSPLDCHFDIAVGAAGSEVVVLPDFWCTMSNSSSSTWIFPTVTPFFAIQIPAGSRISARAGVTTTVLPDRVIGLSFYGARQ